MTNFAHILFAIWLALLAVCIIGLLVCIFMMRKNLNTFKNFMLILNAISAYQRKCVFNHEEYAVGFNDMRDYDKVFNRIWDWGYTRILPKEKFEITV